MKFKKILSLGLALVMLLSAFGAVTVSAASTAKLTFVAYDSTGNKVSGDLKIGEIYEVAAVLSDISDKSLKTVHVVTYFDPQIVQPVRNTGVEATLPAQATVQTVSASDMYNEEEGTGMFAKISKACFLSENMISYGLEIHTDVVKQYPNGVSNNGTFEICRFRFKALKPGNTGICLAKASLGAGKYNEAYDEGIYFYPTADKAVVSEVASNIKVAEPAYTAATVDAGFAASKTYTVDEKTSSGIISELSSSYPSVSVKYTNELGVITKDGAITWSAPSGFDAGKPGTYTFTGAVSTEGVNYTGSAVKVTATVKINALQVISVTNPTDIEVFIGETIKLPSTVSVKVTGNKDATLSVSWAPSFISNLTPGTTSLTGTLTGTDKIEVPANMKAAMKVTVKDKVYTTAKVDSGFSASKSYLVGKTTKDAVLADLRSAYSSVKVVFTNSYGHERDKSLPITWAAPAAFNANTKGTYTFEGTVSTEGINYTGSAVKVTATVIVDTLKVISVINPSDINVFVGDAITLPATVKVKVTGDTEETLAVTWTPSSVSNTVIGTTTLTGVLTGTDKIEVPADKKATLKVTVKDKVYTSASLAAAFTASKSYDVDTTANLVSELSSAYPSVSVKFTNANGHEFTKTCSISWSAPSGFSTENIGTYTFTGIVSTDGVNYTGSAVKVTATVKINALQVVSVTNPADIEVFVGDTITLPATVKVKVTGNKDATLNVKWTPSSVSNTIAGTTTLTGILTGTEKIIVSVDKKATLKVVVKNKVYTSAEVSASFTASKSYLIGTTTKEAVLTDLKLAYPSVSVKFSDAYGHETSKTSTITWSAPADFNAAKAGTYTFEGVVSTSGVNYTGSAVKVTATVVIDTLKVISVKNPEDITVFAGETITLPETVTVTVTGDKEETLSVIWTPSSVDNTVGGTTNLVGTLTGNTDIEVPADKKATMKVTVIAKSTNNNPSKIEDISASCDVDAENLVETVVSALPGYVMAEDGYILVTWTQTEESKKDKYTSSDVLEFVPVADGVTFPADFTAKVTLTVPDGKSTFAFDKTEYTISNKKVNSDYSLDDAKKTAEFNVTYKDGTKVKATDIVWAEDTEPAYKNNKTGKYVLTGTWSDIYGNTETLKITINIVPNGATGIGLYNTLTSMKPIGASITLGTLSTKNLYAKLTPEGVEDTLTYSVDKPQYVTVSIQGTMVTIRTKSVASIVNLTVYTSSGASTTLRIVINSAPAGGGGGGGGAGQPENGNTNIPSVPPVVAPDPVPGTTPGTTDTVEPEIPVGFTDLENYKWAEEQINTLKDLGIVSGKTENLFAPGDYVTRAEFLAMLVRLFDFQLSGDAKTFSDVSPDKWFYEAVSIASSLGIAYGYENGAFDPNAVIKREDMAVFAERALNMAGIVPEKGEEKLFADQDAISGYAVDPVLYMTAIGVINGMEDGTFMPLETANRAQAAVVIYNLYMLINQQ